MSALLIVPGLVAAALAFVLPNGGWRDFDILVLVGSFLAVSWFRERAP